VGGAVSRLVLLACAAATSLAGCTTVKVAQPDGCWIRQTRTVFSSSEELGPCARPEPKWSDDRITRVTQECVAQADYRWQGRALEAWRRGQPLPERPSDDTLLNECMEQVSRSQLAENERLRHRLVELGAEKEALAQQAGKDRSQLIAGYEKMAGDLGLAARRPAPPAIATATARSEGRTTSEGRSTSDTDKEPRVVVATPISSAPAAPAPAQAKSKKASAKPATRAPVDCPPAAEATTTGSDKIKKISADPDVTPSP